MKQIALSNGGVAIVDDDDYERIARYKWFRHANGYAYRVLRDGRRYIKSIYMHRAIMRHLRGRVDHINRDKLDNRRANLRSTTHADNILNSGCHVTGLWKSNTSGVRGVDYDKARDKWTARINVYGVTHRLGRFPTKEDAAQARYSAERQFGVFDLIHQQKET